MATLLSDVIVPDVWVPYMQEQTEEKSALFQSGIVATDSELDQALNGGGKQVEVPFFKDLEGADQVRASDSALSVNKIGTDKDLARLHGRAQAWGAEDLSAELSGADPMESIANRVADYWSRRMQKLLIASLEGVFAANDTDDGGDLILDVFGDGEDLNSDIILDGKQLLGDAKEKLTAICMHSAKHTELQKKDLIEYIPDSQADVGLSVSYLTE